MQPVMYFWKPLSQKKQYEFIIEKRLVRKTGNDLKSQPTVTKIIDYSNQT